MNNSKNPAKVGALRATLTDGLHMEAGNNISWRSIFAGLVTFVALSLLFTLVGAAIGLGGTDLRSANPTEGVGTGLMIWTIFSLIISLGAAGFIAGLTANRAGFIHGFLTWATGLIVMVIIATSAISSALGAVGNMLGAAGRAAGDVVSTATQATGNVANDAFNLVAEQVEVDTTGINKEVLTALENSSVKQFHPDYLQTQLDDTIKDVKAAGERILVKGENPADVANDVKGNIEKRVASVTDKINRPTLEREIAANTDLTQQEVKKAADNVVSAYEDAQKNAEKQLNNLQSGAQDAFENGVKVADDALNNTAKYSMYLFIGLLVAGIVTTVAGIFGSRFGRKVENV